MTKLPTLGGSLTRAFAVNNRGQVVGQSYTTGFDWHAFVWSRSAEMQDLGTLGGSRSVAYGINDDGQVVGQAEDNTAGHAFLWSRVEGMQDLGTLGGPYSIAQAINNKGDVVGTSEIIGPGLRAHAFLWTRAGGMQDLGTLGELGSSAMDINDNGQVVGLSYFDDGSMHAFLWTQAEGMQDLGTLGGPNSVATRINAAGDVVGGSDVGGGFQHAFLWTQAAGMQDLGALPGFTNAAANDITDSGEIIGSSWSLNVKPPSGSPFLWTKNDGMKALGPFNKTLVTNGDGINKAGVILASRYTGQYGYTSFVLSPAMRTTLVSSLNPTMFGNQVTLQAQVNSLVVGAPPDGEKVTITDGNSTLATVPLLSGSATFRTSTLKAGTHALQAVYAGDLNYGSSKSSVLEQTVNPYQTAVSLGSNLNPSLYGQAVTWSAMVTTTGGVAPTGNVVFRWSRDGLNYTIGTAPLNAAGVATLTRSNLNADPFGEAYPLVAVYVGDAMNPGNTSAVLPQHVLQTKTAANIRSSVNPSGTGQVVTLTATITSPTVTPTGPVIFTAGKQVLGTAQIVPWSHKATLAISTLPVGSTVIKATYPGDSNIAKSSASLTQTVQ